MRLRGTEEDKGPRKTKGQGADGVSARGKKGGKKKTSALT